MTKCAHLSMTEYLRHPRCVSSSLTPVLLKAGAVALCLVATVGNPLAAQHPAGYRASISDCDSLPWACDDPGMLPMYPLPPGDVPQQRAARPSEGDPGIPRGPREAGDAPGADSAAADDGFDGALDGSDEGDGDFGDFDDFDSSTFSLNSNLASAGVQRGNFSAAPTMTGDLFGAGVSQLSGVQRLSFSDVMSGFLLNEVPGGSANALLGFGSGSQEPDIFSSGLGTDTTGDEFADQFSILEPGPSSGAETPPGRGFVFEGGTAIFLGENPDATTPQPGAFGNGDDWRLDYSYSQAIGLEDGPIVLAGPDVATRRVKLSENFSPEVRDRAYMNYNYFNNAFGGLGDVNRWVLGWERVLVDDLVSIELRQPMATTLGSRQDIDSPGDRSYELGNLTAVGKVVLYRDERSLWSSGLGVTAPLADDARLMRGDETLLRINNQAVHLLPFAAVLMRYNRDTLFQLFTQLDVDVNGNEIRGDLSGGPLPVLGRLHDSALLHLDASVHRTLIRRPRNKLVREVIGNAELHYTGSLESADVVSGSGLTVTDLARRFDIVNATFSSHWLMGENVVVTPGMSVPLQGGLNRQFNFEAILQLNYLR